MVRLELKVPPVLIVIIVSVLMWIVSTFTASSNMLSSLSGWLSPSCFAIGLFYVLAGVGSFMKAHTTVNPMMPESATSLVTRGIYQYTRNPMYVGFALGLIGWGIYLSNVYALLMVVVFVAYMNRYQIEPEERSLLALFGSEYEVYLSSVRRWL